MTQPTDLTPIPAPTDEDSAIDLGRFYRYLSGELDVYGTGPRAGDIPSARGIIRRLVAAEQRAAGFEKAAAKCYEVMAERAAEWEKQQAEVPAWLKVLRPHLTNPRTCGCVYDVVCLERVVKAVRERLGVQS